MQRELFWGRLFLEGKQFVKGYESYHPTIFAIGFFCCLCIMIYCHKASAKLLKKRPLNIFAYYRFVLALIIALIWTDAKDA